ncbi:unnamed protein product [Sphagnum jensenii]
MAVIGGGSKYLTRFKETDKDEEDGKTISVHATDGEKTIGFGQDSEALAREENQRAERRLEASVTRKRRGSDNDPAKHSVDVLASFVQTFTKPEDIDLVTLISYVDFLNQNSMNSEECSKTFPSLVESQTAVHSLTSFL